MNKISTHNYFQWWFIFSGDKDADRLSMFYSSLLEEKYFFLDLWSTNNKVFLLLNKYNFIYPKFYKTTTIPLTRDMISSKMISDGKSESNESDRKILVSEDFVTSMRSSWDKVSATSDICSILG